MKKRNFHFIFFILLILHLCSCVHISRSTQSGYSDTTNDKITSIYSGTNAEMSTQSIHNDKLMLKLAAESGLKPEDLATPEGQMKFREALELKALEAQLTDEREKKQYYQNLPWLKDKQEQVEFLKQNGYFARQIWLREKGIGKRPTEIDKPTEDLIANKDIALGMPLEFVKRSWGNPDSVEIAGNSLFGNQRWKYKRYTPSPEGYRLQSRVIYFEGGKVAGWEQIDH